MNVQGKFKLPKKCLRGRKDCFPLSQIVSGKVDGIQSFFCCGENEAESRNVPQDEYTFCSKGEFVDMITHNDKRDLIHHVAVIMGALAVVEEAVREN